RVVRDVRDLGVANGSFQCLADTRRRRRYVDADPYPSTPESLGIGARSDDGKSLFRELAVGKIDGLVVAGLDGGIAPADLDDAAAHVVEFDPVTHADRSV